MKIELVKKTTAIYAKEYYFVRANGSMLDETWTTDPDLAKRHLNDVTERARIHPEDVIETIETVNI